MYILKRAQILIADLWSTFRGEANSPGYFSDIDRLTMFADYRVPQILIHLGLLKCSPKLLSLLNAAGQGRAPLLPANLGPDMGGKLETEIRGSSIQAVECLCDEMKRLRPNLKKLNSILVDFYLWDTAKKLRGNSAFEKSPILYCESIFY